MKPLSIADYLDHLGRAAGGKGAAARESSPFRPRSLPSAQNGAARSEAGLRSPWRTRAPAKRKGKRLPGARHGRQSRFRSQSRRAVNRRRQASRSSPRICGQARRGLRARPRGRPRRGARGGFGPPRGGTRRARRAGGDRTAGVPAQRIRGARERDPVRVEADRGQCRSRRHPHPRAVSLDKQVVKQAVDELCQGDRPAGRGGLRPG